MRIRVGVTGRRVLPAGMEELLAREFDLRIDAVFGAGSAARAEFTVVTPLAEGADRLVAREVLKRPGARMEVVLPMLESDYLETFDSDAARAEFRSMTAGHAPVCLRNTPLPVEGRGAAREEAFWQSGVYVVDNCDILFALWDGQPSRGRGGTSYVVAYAQRTGRALVILWPTCPPPPGRA